MKTQNIPKTEETELKSVPVAKTPEKKAAKSKSPFWHSVLVGGVPGIIIGSLGTLGVEEVYAEPTPQPEPEPSPAPDDVEVVQVAHSVTDDMSFSEAFAAARAEVGPGGAFVWHGNVYGTYRGDDPEWQAMSAEERAEHSQLIMSQVHRVPYTPSSNEPEIVETSETSAETGEVGSGDNVSHSGDDIEVESEVDVHIVGVGQVEAQDGSMIDAAYGTVDGHQSVFADIDGDGEVDTVLIDANDNGQIDDNEIIVGEGSGIYMSELAAEAAVNNADTLDDQLYAEMPDYTNDADTSSFA